MKKTMSHLIINYITLINSLAVTYGFLGLSDKEEEYFNKGIKLAVADNSYPGI